MADKELTCKDCRNPFIFTDRDQAFFAEKGFQEPKRCKGCREKKKAENAMGVQPAAAQAPRPSYDDGPKHQHKKKGSRRHREAW